MATYALIHGAGDVGWYWHLVERELRRRGHEVVVMDLPVDDDAATLADHADAVVAAIGDRREDLVVVAQSYGGYVAPLVCDRVPARPQSDATSGGPFPLAAWPVVPTAVVLCRHDRLLPAAWLRRVARERLGVEPDEIDSGHTPALSHPVELTDLLERIHVRTAAAP